MKEPKILLNRILVLFDAVCFSLALYWTLKNIGRFYEDSNATAITYKKYGETIQDKYPSFSVCFEGNGLYQFNETAIFAAYGLHLRDYEMMLEGKQAFQYEYEPSRRRYSKYPLTPNAVPSIGFNEQDLFQLPEIIGNVSFVAGNQAESIFFGNKDEISDKRAIRKPPFYVSYQSSKLFCLTRKHSDDLDVIRHYDSLTLEQDFLDSNTNLKVFIHHPGQLLRSLDTPRLETPLFRIQDKKVNLRVSQTTLLRKRSVQGDPCNKNIADHDRFLLESLSNDTGCIPPYWKTVIGTHSSLRECTSPDQLKKIFDLSKDYKTILENHEVPCLDMFSSAVWNELVHNDFKICKKCAFLSIVYLDKYYEEISELKDFGFEDFISGLGGFIGIFLGYSMMQIPQLFGMLTFYKCYLD